MTQRMKRIDRSIVRFDERLKSLLMAKSHNQVVSLATNGIGGYDIMTYGKGESSFTICTPTKLKEDELMPCFVSHTDTVSAKKPTRFKLFEGVVSNPDGVLGADDRAGVYCLSRMMEKNIRGIYIFTNGEEIGGLGASACTRHQKFQDLVPNITCFIELDRQDDRDIALYGYDNEDLVELFEQRGYHEAYGSYTDVVDFAEDTGLACLNLSVGYRDQHTKREDLVLADLDHTIDMMLTDLPPELYNEKYVATETFGYGKKFANNYYSWETDIVEVCCEVCNDHAKLYMVEDMMLCGYCAEVGQDTPFKNDDNSTFNKYIDDDTEYMKRLQAMIDEDEANYYKDIDEDIDDVYEGVVL